MTMKLQVDMLFETHPSGEKQQYYKVICRRPSGEAYFMCAATLITPTVTFAQKIIPKNIEELYKQKLQGARLCSALLQ